MTVSPLFRTQIQVGEELIELRPNFACYCAIEEKAGCSLMKIVYRFSQSEFLIKDIVAVVYGGVVGTAEELNGKIPYTIDTLGNMLIKDGWSKHTKDVLEFASRCIMGYGAAVTEQGKEEKELAAVSEKKPMDAQPTT
jgi:hypothetical protein